MSVTVRPSPQHLRGGLAIVANSVHALRTSVRPEGRRRETLNDLLAAEIQY